MGKQNKIPYLPLLGGSYLIMFFCGAFGSLRGALLPMIMEYYEISYSAGGLMFLVFVLPGMTGALITGYLCNRYSTKRVLLSGTAVLAVFALMIPLSPLYSLFLGASVVFSFALALIITSGNITVNSIFESVLPVFKENGINLVHFAFSFGSLLPLAVLAVVMNRLAQWQVPFYFLAVIPFVIFILFSVSSYPKDVKRAAVPGKSEYLTAIRNKQIQRYLLIVIVYAGAEGGIINWLPTYLYDAHSFTKEAASRALLFFFVFFTVGRFIGTMIIHRLNRHILFIIVSTVVVLLLSGSFICNYRPMGVEFLVPLSGLFFAVIFPIFQTNLIEDFREIVASATSLLFTASTVGVTLMPFFIGVANDVVGVQFGIIVSLFSALSMLPLYYFIIKWKRKKGVIAGVPMVRE